MDKYHNIYQRKHVERLGKLCSEFLSCVMEKWTSRRLVLEHDEKDAIELMRFLDADLSAIGITDDFRAMSHKELQGSLRRFDETTRNTTALMLIEVIGESQALNYVDSMHELYNDIHFDRENVPEDMETVRFTLLLMANLIWAILR